MAKSKDREELTALMHSEFKVSDEADQKHATWTALDVIKDGSLTKSEAMEEYGITDQDIARYIKEWEELSAE
jgi:hypothetical protein